MPGKAREINTAMTAAERRFDEALRLGQVELSDMPPLDVRGTDFDAERVVRGEYLTRRLVESTEDSGWWPFSRRTSQQPVVVVQDALITGEVVLRAAELPYLLKFVRCRFENEPDLRQASLAGLLLDDCKLPGLAARNLRTSNDTVLRGCINDGLLDLADAEFGGTLRLDDSELRRPDERAMYADRLSVAGAFLALRLRVTGEIRVPGAKIGGNLNISGGTLHRPGGLALNGNGIQVGGSVRLDADPRGSGPTRVTGLLYFPSAHIAGDVRMGGAVLDPGARPPALGDSQYDDPCSTFIADRADIRGDVLLRNGFRSNGTIRVVSAQIGGDVRMVGARVDSAWARSPTEFAVEPLRALHWDGTGILGNVEATAVELRGQVAMTDVQVHGSFLLNRATVYAPRTDVVRAGRIRIGGDLDLQRADVAGTLHLQGARVGASVDLRAARLSKPAWHHHQRAYKSAVDLRTARIERDLICAAGDEPFVAEGEVQLRRAEIGRQANFWGCVLGEEGSANALNAFGLVVQELTLRPAEPPRARIVLRQAQCELLADNAELWSAADGVIAEDFSYEAFSEPIQPADDARVRERLHWLRSTGRNYAPGPYDQLARVFRQNGTEQHAAMVLMEKESRRYQSIAASARPMFRWPVRLWSFLQRVTVSYGYRPARALLWLVVLSVLGTTWFSFNRLSPINQDDEPVWNPFLYTVDHMVPVVNLGHEGTWRAMGASQWITVLLIAAGWILATTVAAGITRTLRRGESKRPPG